MSVVVKKNRPGRPKSVTKIDYLRTQYWVFMALKLSKLNTMTALERMVSVHTFHKLEDQGRYIYPNVFNKYGNGTKKVGTEILARTNNAVPGSSYYYYHPVWDLLDENFSGLEGLYSLLASINPRLSDYLFEPESKRGRLRRRKKTGRDTVYTLTIFESENDLDALAVVFGLMYEARYYGETYIYTYLAARLMITCLAVFTPIENFVFKLLTILESKFDKYSNPSGEKYYSDTDEVVTAEIAVSKYFVNYKKINNIFKLFCPTHITFLNFLLYDINTSLAVELANLLNANLEEELLAHPKVKQFLKEMEKWEQFAFERQDPYFNHNFIPPMVRLEPEYSSKTYDLDWNEDFSFPREHEE